MKKLNFVGLLATLVLLFSSCATVYNAADLKTAEAQHKLIAILPFDVMVQYNKLPKNVTVEQIHENEHELSFVFQNQMYNRFLRKGDQFSVRFQDVDKTNMMLERNKIEVGQLSEFSADELARLLDVDAIISGKVITSKPMSTGAAIVVGALFGLWGSTNTADVTVSLHDGNNSELLWRFNHVYSGSVGSSPEQLTKAMMNPISRKFPYKVK
ncbi:MAG TPA: hypothetical protein VKA38_02590 [Draconibacterium sp.]|nr:hypothetical protein [Draconibacterium sp.]